MDQTIGIQRPRTSSFSEFNPHPTLVAQIIKMGSSLLARSTEHQGRQEKRKSQTAKWTPPLARVRRSGKETGTIKQE